MGGQLQANRPWRWAAASQIGSSHIRQGSRKQDALRVIRLEDDALCVAVCDGAGSASWGGQGASLTCKMLSQQFRAWFALHRSLPSDDTVLVWIDDLRDQLAVAASRRAVERRQFASTLVLLVVHHDQALILHIGDGAVVARQEGAWETVSSPENGEFASTTFFITDDPEVRLRIHRFETHHDAFVVFSDGIESLALDQSSHSASPRFFDPMMRPVDQASEPGRVPKLCEALARYLDSNTICERTDDDKTLVLLSRQ